jgi:hypothetical protein
MIEADEHNRVLQARIKELEGTITERDLTIQARMLSCWVIGFTTIRRF